MTVATTSRGRHAGGAVTLARGAATFAGAVSAAVAGLALTVLVGRSLGAAGAGIFFSVVAIFTIATTVLKLGADTGQLWRIPRLLAEDRTAELVPGLRQSLVPPMLLSVSAAVALAGLSGWIARHIASPGLVGDARAQLLWAALGLAFMAPMMIVVAATRGLGLVAPFVLVQNIGLPLGRLVAVGVALLLGGGGVTVMAAWSLPVIAAFVVGAVWLMVEVRRVLAARATAAAPRRPPAELRREFLQFTVPRGITASIETVLVMVNTLVAGLFIGPAAAGVFGGLSRFVTSGTLAEQTVRVLVAPRFSALLGSGDADAASRLYSITTAWIVLVSWPVFVVLGAGAPAVLSLLGDDFRTGASALLILSGTMCVSQAAGNVQTILLMSGNSRLQLLNKTVAVVVLLGLDVALIPAWGLVGAAVAWSASILVDTLLAAGQVRWVVGLRLRAPLLPALGLGSLVAFGVPVTVATQLSGAGGSVRVIVAAGVGLLLYLPLVWRKRHELQLTALRSHRSVDAPLGARGGGAGGR